MKILITGIHGFVGSNLVKGWAGRHEVYGVDIVTPHVDGVMKTFSWNDLDNDTLPPVDVIIHLAGIAHDTNNRSTADAYFSVNTQLTKKAFDYFLNHPATSQFIFFSSVKAAVDKVPGDILTEDVEATPVGPYGESKVLAEKYIQQHLPEVNRQGRRAIILRPCMIHGPGNKGNLNLLYAVVSKGVPWPLGAFDNRRSFTSFENLEFVINGLLSKRVESGVYNMADDEPLSTNELIRIICSVLEKKPKIWKLNKNFIILSSKLGDLLKLPLNSFRLNKLTENYVVSNAKIKKALDIKKMPISAVGGLRYTIGSFAEKQKR